MPGVGRSDDYGIDILSLEDFLIVTGRINIVAPFLLSVCQAAIVEVAGSYQFHTGHFDSSVGIFCTHTAGSDEGDLDIVVGAIMIFLTRQLLEALLAIGGGYDIRDQ